MKNSIVMDNKKLLEMNQEVIMNEMRLKMINARVYSRWLASQAKIDNRPSEKSINFSKPKSKRPWENIYQ